jgi:hypothetical protein
MHELLYKWSIPPFFKHLIYSVGFEDLTVVVIKSSAFWDITPCSLLKVNQRFRGTCRPPSSGSKNKPSTRNQREAASYVIHAGFVLGLFFDTEDQGRHVPLKRWLTFNRLHGIISQKIELYI